MITALGSGAGISAGLDHPAYRVAPFELPREIRNSLAGDVRPGVLN
jgi:hypothetical protein